jgi:hypothetical protein
MEEAFYHVVSEYKLLSLKHSKDNSKLKTAGERAYKKRMIILSPPSGTFAMSKCQSWSFFCENNLMGSYTLAGEFCYKKLI